MLLDAAQRVYKPGLTATGDLVARIQGEIAFAGPDLEIDAEPAVLVAGEVVLAKRLPRPTSSEPGVIAAGLRAVSSGRRSPGLPAASSSR